MQRVGMGSAVGKGGVHELGPKSCTTTMTSATRGKCRRVAFMI